MNISRFYSNTCTFFFLCLLLCGPEWVRGQNAFKPAVQLACCARQAEKTLRLISPNTGANLPRNNDNQTMDWRFVNYRDWCSGFWPWKREKQTGLLH